MASGKPSDRTSSGPRSFGFGSDDVLCAYDDFTNQEPNNGRRSDPSPKDSHENILGRPLVGVYGQQDEYPKEEIITAVEKCMKKYADNLLRHLEGISGRLSQLEIYCYKLGSSLGEFQAGMFCDHGEVDTKFKSLEKNLHEVHGSIQILRDKQELDEAQKELTKLQLAPKESSTPTLPQKSEPEPKQHNETADFPNPHLALALHQQISPPSSLPTSKPQQPPSYDLNQPVAFYPHGPQQTQPPLQPEPQYLPSIQAPPPPQIASQAQPPQSYPQYQHQQWSHPTSHQFAQQSIPQPQLVRPHTSFGYSIVPQSGGDHTEAVPYGYGPPNSAVSVSSQPQQQQQQPPPKVSSYANVAVAPYPPQSSMQGYDTVYPPGGFHQPHRTMRDHPYADVIEKAASMGYPRLHVIGNVNEMADSGQPVDLNTLLDRLNSRAGAGPPRAWSG